MWKTDLIHIKQSKWKNFVLKMIVLCVRNRTFLCHPSLFQTHGFKASSCLSFLNSGDDRYLLLSPAEDTSVSVLKYTGAYTVILLDPICLLTIQERNFQGFVLAADNSSTTDEIGGQQLVILTISAFRMIYIQDMFSTVLQVL